MKNVIAACLAFVLVLSAAGCGANGQPAAKESWDRIPMVMVDGVLYLDTGMQSDSEREDSLMDGEITSAVDGSEVPTKNNQSNFGTGYGYQYGTEGTIELFIHGKWWIYATEEARQELQFPSETANAESVAEDFTYSNAVYLGQFVKDCLAEPDSFQIHVVSHIEENGRHFYYLDFSHQIKREEMERTYYFAEFDGDTLLCIVHERSSIFYETEGDYTEKYAALSEMFREQRTESLDTGRILSGLK